MAYHSLDLLDKKILKLIADDARIPFLEVARVCNVSGAAIHQRIQKLTSLGILKGSQFIIDPEMIGYDTCAYIGLCLKDPERFEEVVNELRKIPEVVDSTCSSRFTLSTIIICLTLFTTSCNRSAWHAVRPLYHSMQRSAVRCRYPTFLSQRMRRKNNIG